MSLYAKLNKENIVSGIGNSGLPNNSDNDNNYDYDKYMYILRLTFN